MASNNQNQLLDEFAAIAAQGSAEARSALAATKDLMQWLSQFAAQATTGSLLGAVNSASEGGGSAWSVAKTVVESGLGIGPLIGSLIGLFSGGGDAQPPALTKYVMPGALNFQSAETHGGSAGVDYDQFGMPRAFGGAAASQNGASEDSAPSGSGGLGGPPAQITVNVNAMDARSFLDRSGDIAAAVRNAMLNSNSINDVINDL